MAKLNIVRFTELASSLIVAGLQKEEERPRKVLPTILKYAVSKLKPLKTYCL